MTHRHALVFVFLMGAVACKREPAPMTPPPVAPTTEVPGLNVPAPPTAPTPVTPGVGGPDFASLAERVVPAVVSIQVEQHVKMGRRGPHGGPSDLYRFFGQDAPREYDNHGLGSGFVIRADGLILTNAHVVEKADRIDVTFATADGQERTLKAKVLGQTLDYDVALIKTEEDAKVPVVALGDSDVLRIGEWVMAVGNPFGLAHSVSVGIISAKQRRDIAPSGRQGLYDFLQTDASINPGNSGGPLINSRGEVIGINSAINAQGQGIGFAIPINMVKQMLPQLEKSGKFVRSWVGVKIQPMTPELAQSYGLDASRGVLVVDVVPNGPAAKAGLQEGDIILEFDGKKLYRASDLQIFASMAGVGQSVPLSVWRNKQTRPVPLKLEAFPEEDEEGVADGEGKDEGAGLGLTLSNLTPDARQQLGLESDHGALVQDTEPGSIAARAGLRRGDLIVGIDGQEVRRAEDLIKRVKSAASGAVLRLKVERQGGRLFLALRKP